MGKFQLTSGVPRRPDANIVTGRSNIGKTWFMSTIPDIHMLCTEDGLKGASPDHVEQVRHFGRQPASFGEGLEMIDELAAMAKVNRARHLGYDSLWGWERLINKEVCRSESVAHMDAKEFKTLWTAAQALHQRLRERFDRARDTSGCHLWIAAHSAEVTESTGDGDQFRKYDLSFEGTGNSLIQIRESWRKWADNVLFIDWDASVKKGSIGKKQVGVYKARVLRTRETPAYYAKNRRNLPEKLPATWVDLAKALNAGQTASDEKLRAQIAEVMEELCATDRADVDADLRAAKTNSALSAVLSRAKGLASSTDEDGTPANQPTTSGDTDAAGSEAPNFMPDEEPEPQAAGPNTDFIDLGTRIERSDAKPEIDAAMKDVTAAFQAGRITHEEGKKLGAMASARVKAFRAEALAAEQALAAKENETSEAAA